VIFDCVDLGIGDIDSVELMFMLVLMEGGHRVVCADGM
jgi:hypothetical protein